jgi:transcription initiation factor IIF auxiliary subunit
MRLRSATLVILLSGCLPVWSQDVAVANTARYQGHGRYSWTVFLKGEPAALQQVKGVQYTLHPTFSKPVVWGSGRSFSYSAIGWGEFNIVATIYYKNGRSEIVNHWLRLSSRSAAASRR